MTQPSLSPVPDPQKEADTGLSIGGQFAAVFNVLVDPPSVAKIIPTRLAWLVPFVIGSVAMIVMSMVTSPITASIMRNNPPEGMSPEQAQNAAAMVEKFAVVGMVASPIVMAIILCIAAGLAMAVCSITGVNARFSQLFKIFNYTGIVRTVGVLAGAAVVKAKAGEIQTTAELAPRFGLDLFIHDVPKAVRGMLQFFSIFTIWEAVVTIVILVTALKISKGKAIGIMVPVWLLGLVLTVVGALFQR